MGFMPAFLGIVICYWPRKKGGNKWVYIAVSKFLVRQLMFMAVQMLECNEETDCTDSGEYSQLEALKNVLHQHPAGLVGLSPLACFRLGTALGAPSQAPSCRLLPWWEQGPGNEHGDVGTPRSTSKGAWVRKGRLCMTSYKAQAF